MIDVFVNIDHFHKYALSELKVVTSTRSRASRGRRKKKLDGISVH